MEVTCTNNMLTVLLYNGLCTSNMFMVLQVVVLWIGCIWLIHFVLLYNLNTFEYKNIFYRGWGGLTKVMWLIRIRSLHWLRLTIKGTATDFNSGITKNKVWSRVSGVRFQQVSLSRSEDTADRGTTQRETWSKSIAKRTVYRTYIYIYKLDARLDSPCFSHDKALNAGRY